MGVKDALAEKTGNKGEVKLTKSMSIADMIKAMKPEIEKALPKVITPERFTRMALSALNNHPEATGVQPDVFPWCAYECGAARSGTKHTVGTSISDSI